MKPPAEWYAEQDLSKHYMRRADRPWEEGVSRGQLRRIAKCEATGMVFGKCDIVIAYTYVEENRLDKGRKYGMTFKDWEALERIPSTAYSFSLEPDHAAVALCVVVSSTVLYVSGWSHRRGYDNLSPVCLLAKGIYNYCAANGFTTLDIGIGGDPGLDSFKRRLGFRLPEEGM